MNKIFCHKCENDIINIFPKHQCSVASKSRFISREIIQQYTNCDINILSKDRYRLCNIMRHEMYKKRKYNEFDIVSDNYEENNYTRRK